MESTENWIVAASEFQKERKKKNKKELIEETGLEFRILIKIMKGLIN